MRLIISAIIAAGLVSAPALATPCRDSHGKFVKCKTVKMARCKDAKGKFAKCGSKGAVPVKG